MDIIERELSGLESRIFKVLEEEGISREEAMHAAHEVLREPSELLSVNRRKKQGAGFVALTAVGLTRYLIEHEPDNPEIIPMLVVVAEAVGSLEGAQMIDRMVENGLGGSLGDFLNGARSALVKSITKKANDASHARNREIAERIQAWYTENHQRFRSMDAAAEAVTKIEPVAFKTARKHVGIAAKNLPSARKE